MHYLIKEETMTGIADAIRNKIGSVDPIPVPTMAEKISCITTDSETVLEGLTVEPTGQEIVKIPDVGVDGFGIVTVTGDVNLVPENVKEGVTIYGVEGTCSEGIDTSDATATAEDILDSATAYVNGVKIVGTHACPPPPVLETLYIDPDGTDQTHAPGDGVDGFAEVIVMGDDNLVSEHIREGVTIYGVKGKLSAESFAGELGLDSVTIEPTGKEITMVPEEGHLGWNSIVVTGDENLIPANIKKGVTIYGVDGAATGIGASANVRIIDHSPTLSDLTGGTSILAQYNPTSIPTGTEDYSTGIYGATAIYVEAPCEYDTENVTDPSDEAVMLFDGGDQCFDLTGGWIAGRVLVHDLSVYEGDPPYSSIGSSMELHGGKVIRPLYHDGHAYVKTVNPVSLEGYSKVYVDVLTNQDGIGTSWCFDMTSDSSATNGGMNFSHDPGRYTADFNISLTSAYILISLCSDRFVTNAESRIFRIWLEP